MTTRDPQIARELLSHQDFLRRLAADLVGGDADDLVQDVWQRVLERPPRHGRQLRGWLARVARNLAANRWRDAARRVEREERRASERAGSEDVEARFELRKELVGALDDLGAPYREAILLRHFEGLAPQEIARRQGVPVATVKTRLRRGLAQLREVLDRRHAGERGAWLPGLAALALPVDRGVGAGTLVIGGIAVGTTTKVCAAVLAVAVGVYLVTRTPEAEAPRVAEVEPVASAAEPARYELVPEVEGVAARSAAEVETAAAVVPGTQVLRVVVEGITDEEARSATVTWRAADDDGALPVASRSLHGRTSEFDLGPYLASAPGTDALEVEVEHPLHLAATTRVALSGTASVHEARVRLPEVVYWPELRLSVRDATTRAHLADVELVALSSAFMGTPLLPGVGEPFTALGAGRSSPIELRGGHDADDPEQLVAGLALRPAPGEAARLFEASREGRVRVERGVLVYARAPGYAWGSISLDVSEGDRELLLEPGCALDVRLTNVQLERYAALGGEARLYVHRLWPDGDRSFVRHQGVEETQEAGGLRLEGIEPGEHVVSVELGGAFASQRPVLASEELTLVAGETREIVLALADPPVPLARATLGGVVSFPTFGGEEHVRLQVYSQTSFYRRPDVELALADLRRVGGALPSWSFELEDLPVGTYRLQLQPFAKSWVVELPAAGRQDVELVLPELAEVTVETVDGRTGERVPLDAFYFRVQEELPHDHDNDWARAETLEPGRFRFRAATGAVRIWPRSQGRLGYGLAWRSLELTPGPRAVRFELPPLYGMHFEFREDGTPLPIGPQGLQVTRDIRPVGHEGRVTGDGLQTSMVVEVSAPGPYEILFDGLDADLYHPLPPRRVDVRAGEVVEVVVELRRR